MNSELVWFAACKSLTVTYGSVKRKLAALILAKQKAAIYLYNNEKRATSSLTILTSAHTIISCC